MQYRRVAAEETFGQIVVSTKASSPARIYCILVCKQVAYRRRLRGRRLAP
jgi:hypothetical protein